MGKCARANDKSVRLSGVNMKRIVTILAVVVLSLAFGLCLFACDEKADDSPTIVFLGDSIAEALIGPSPVSERDNYGYYALIGRVNGFNYFNHSMSGHLTSGNMADKVNGEGLLQIISRESETATLIQTHIKQADIIHISVLGNNALQFDLGAMLMEMADINKGKTGADRWYQACFDGAAKESELKNRYDDNHTLFEYLHDGGVNDDDETPIRPMIDFAQDGKTLVYGQNQGAEDSIFNFPNTYQDIEDIVARLRTLNPNAKIIFQKVYNPVVEDTKLITPAYRQALANRGYDTYQKLRVLAQDILDKLNGMIDEYNDNHQSEQVYVLDINKAFNDLAATDTVEVDGQKVINLSQESIARRLIFADYTHPSNLGHAIVAAETQKMLDEWGMGAKDALDKYKAIKCEQLERMYSNIDSFDVEAAKKAVEDENSYYGVSLKYFDLIGGIAPSTY